MGELEIFLDDEEFKVEEEFQGNRMNMMRGLKRLWAENQRNKHLSKYVTLFAQKDQLTEEACLTYVNSIHKPIDQMKRRKEIEDKLGITSKLYCHLQMY